MTCSRITDVMERFLEVMKKALEEQDDVDEYCVYERDIRGYIVPRLNPQVKKVYACGAYATIFRSYRLYVVPGAVVFYDVDLDGTRCRVARDYDSVARRIMKRPHYVVCIYDQPVGLDRALICA